MSLVNPKQYIISARSNGYKDTAYAIAELADNSIQAGADKVEILIFENKNRSIDQIAIADNGKGMSKELLATALGFGESGRDKDKEGNLLNDDTQGMGKFGMGLPNASVSQCKRVEVWSWKAVGEVNYSYLDVQEIIDGDYLDLPTPSSSRIPEKYLNSMFNGDIPSSGTLVVWSNLDKLKWKRAKTLFEKSESEIGRMYRYFIASNQCSVQFKVCDLHGSVKTKALEPLTKTGIIKANDPLYLTGDSSLPELPGLHRDEAQTFFEEKEHSFSWEVEYLGKVHTLTIRSSVARNEIIQRMLQATSFNKIGDTHWGKHCAKNIGLSVLRAKRELEVITNEFFLKSDVYQIRFIGIELEIPPALDEVFGVTNNKQHAHNLKDMSQNEFFNGENELKNEKSIISHLKLIGEEDTAILFDVSRKLSQVIANRKKDMGKLTLSKAKVVDTEITEDDRLGIVINAGFKKRDEVNPGTTISKDPNYGELEKKLIEDFGYDKDQAAQAARKMEDLKSRISIQYRKTSNQSFFEVENLQGITVLVINPEHELYKHFLSKMSDKDQLLFKVILGAWARLEDETTIETKRRQLERARNDWGEIIEDMFEEFDFETLEEA
ncbi:ATP-binding protein [Colwellia sp. 12G3]|uniref:ATP-binding protein n=1 Tax=Colwellia sp. 12G3 TaxID=2058299 RepID=UPI000C349807|nr:ATP-binding protein [Colwellia sp. 12G3]PKI12751.1 hypothetical protein CXF71_18625 [Colwellia sp. 12G3]